MIRKNNGLPAKNRKFKMLQQGRDALHWLSNRLKTPKERLICRFLGVFNFPVVRISTAVKSPNSTSRYKGAILVIAALFVPLGVLLGGLTPGRADAATSSTLNFQGRLMSAGGSLVADGTYNMQFNLYTVASAGTTQWTDTRLNSSGQGVQIKNGYFSVNLADSSAGGTAFPGTINWDQEQWLGMTIRGTGSCAFGACTPTDAEMTPRFKLTAVPYAFSAGQLQKTNGSFTSTVNLTTPTANRAILFPDAAGTVALQTSNYTTNGVIYATANSTQLSTAAGTTGQCLIATSAAAPSWGSCAGSGSGATLQAAYDNGNTITTTNARNILFTLVDTATDPNFFVNIATGSTGRFAVQNNGTDSLSVTSSALTAAATTINLNSANLATNQTTVAVLNTTATTVNAFGAATAINIGAATGTLTVKNAATVLNGTLAAGQTTITATAPNVSGGAALSVSATGTSTTNNQFGVNGSITATPGAASGQAYIGTSGYAMSASGNMASGDLYGLYGGAEYSGTGTLAQGWGALLERFNTSTGTITSSVGLSVRDLSNPSGTATYNTGIHIAEQTGGATGTVNLFIGSSTPPNGSWNIYSDSTDNNALAGRLRVGGTSAPTVELDVTGSGIFSGTLVVADTTTVGNSVLGSNTSTGTTGTSSGAGGTNVTTIALAAAGGFANGDVILVNNTGGSGQDYYTRITSGGGTTSLTVSPAVSYGTAAGYTGNAAITKYTVQNVGAANTGTSFADSARFFQGYFLGGVVTGAGSTTLSDQNLTSTQALYLNTGGQNTRLYVSGTGNVGIGNLNNTYKLDVTGEINASTGFRAGGTAGVATTTCSGGTPNYTATSVSGGIITAGSCTASSGVTGSGSSGQLTFWSGASTLTSSALLNWDTTKGNLGIGTAAPAANLQVAQQTNGIGTVTTNGTITLTGVGTQFTNTFKVGDTITVSGETVRTIATIPSDTSLTVTVAFSTSTPGHTYTLTGGTRLVVQGNGNVGIGTIAPAGLLDVAGSARFQSAFIKAASGTTTIQIQDGVPSTTSTISLSNALFTIANNANPMVLNANTNGGNTNQLYLATSGAVGIGTASPEGLQVNLAVSETARGVDNARLGIVSGTPRLILEDSGSTQWQIDNNAGTLRIFQPGVVKITYDPSNVFSLNLKNTIDASDSYLRLNNAGAYASGIYSPGVLRIDSTISANTSLTAGSTGPITGRKLEEVSGNGDGISLGQDTDNTSSIQAWIDGQWSNRTTYASGCCNTLKLQPDVGNVQIGSNGSPGNGLTVYGTSNLQTLNSSRHIINDSGAAANFVVMINGGTYFQVNTDGSSTFAGEVITPTVNIPDSPTNTVQVCYEFAPGSRIRMRRCASSSRKYKNTINTYQSGLDSVRALNPVTFLYNQGYSNDTSLQVGFIAEEIAEIDPLFAIYKDGVVESVRYDRITVLNTNAIKELDLQVQSIQASVNSHSLRITTLEAGNFSGNLHVQGYTELEGNLVVRGNTTLASLKVTGDTVLANLTVDRIISHGDTPMGVLGATTGQNGTVTINGNDTAGTVTYVAGSQSLPTHPLGAGEQIKLTFKKPYAATPRVVLTPTSDHAADVRYYIERTATDFKLIFKDPPVAGTTYQYDYIIVQ